MSAVENYLEPDREQIRAFADAIFRNIAGEQGYISIRSFLDRGEDDGGVFRISPVRLNGRGLDFLIDVAVNDARRAAMDPKRVVFCPPLAVFADKDKATEATLTHGPVLSVELDERPMDALSKIEAVIGPATVVVRSGGIWIDPETGEVQDKLHAHWRLRQPACGADKDKLKQARRLVTILAGGDPSTIPIVHPLRWPGSWHRKNTPRMCVIERVDAEREIDLDAALAALQAAVPAVTPGPANGESSAADNDTQSKPWQKLLSDILTGREIYPNVVPFTNKLQRTGMNDGAVVSLTRAIVSLSAASANEPERVQNSYSKIPAMVHDGRVKIDAETCEKTPTSIAEEQPWPEMNAAAFHGLIGEIVRTIEPHTEADAPAILLQLLCAVGNVIGREPHYKVEGDRHGANIFCVIVGETSKGRKGVGLNRVKSIMRCVDERWSLERETHGLGSGEGLIHAVRDPVEKWNVKEQKNEISDPGVTDKRLLVTETEFAKVLSVAARQGNSLSPIVRQAWETGTLKNTVRNNPETATGAHVSVVGHISADELRDKLTETEVAGGFANRYLYALSRRSKELPFGGSLSDEDIERLAERLKPAIKAASTRGRTGMATKARALWAAIYHDLSAPIPGLAGAVCARAEPQVIRLALIHALIDGAPDIDEPHLRAAMAVWDYCEASARHVFGNSTGNVTADAIMRSLKTAGKDGMSRTDINDMLGRNKGAGAISNALMVLHRLGHTHMAQRKTGGRASEMWFAT